MHRSGFLFLGLLGASLAIGCPAPPPEEPSGDAPPAGAVSDGGAPDAAPVSGGGAAAMRPGDNGGPRAPATFQDLIEQGGGKTLTISGQVHGAKEGQIDFVAVVKREGRTMPEHLQSIRFENGRFSVEAPASYENPLVATAMVMDEGEQPEMDTPSGAVASTFKLSGDDIVLDITIGEHSDPTEFFPLEQGMDPALGAQGGGQGDPSAQGALTPVGEAPAPEGEAPAPEGEAPAPEGEAPEGEGPA